MKNSTLIYLTCCLIATTALTSCKKSGCTDPLGSNYNSEATKDDQSCSYYYGGKNFGQLEVSSEINMGGSWTCYIDNQSVGILEYYFPSGATCANPNNVGTIIQAGTYLVRAVQADNTTREGYVTLDPQECKVVLIENLTLVTSGGSGSGGGGGTSTGNLTFWTNQDLGCGNITVSIASYGSQTISYYYSSGNPGCSATGCANFYSLNYGAYSYTATSSNGCTWNGNIVVDQSCETLQLTL